ncbi:MAG: PD40 domain-containing protein [Acidobacteria bacterium]|nr:PD40 domain-containing protein [Acidobacteriota bacterium]
MFAVSSGDRAILARYFPERGDWAPLGIEGIGPIQYLQSGHILFQQAGATVVAPFDPSAGRLTGPPTRILEAADPQHLAVSPSGTVAYVHFPEGTGMSLVRIDRSGSREPLVERRQAYRWPRLSPDGRRLVVGIQGAALVARLWLIDLTDGRRDLLQDGGGGNSEPVWTREGEKIAYSSRRSTSDVYWQAGRGGGESEMLSEEPIDQWPTSFPPDGKLLAFYGGPTGGDQDIWVVPTEGGGQARVVVDDPGTQRGGRFSPDGRWLLYSSAEAGEPAIYAQRYPDWIAGFWCHPRAGSIRRGRLMGEKSSIPTATG